MPTPPTTNAAGGFTKKPCHAPIPFSAVVKVAASTGPTAPTAGGPTSANASGGSGTQKLPLTSLTPSGRFRVCYADPPWPTQQVGARGAVRHYDLMTIADIATMPIASLMQPNATLLLWTTNAALPDALEVMKAWGFTYKTNAVWDKYFMGLGNYFRGSHELLLHGVRGKAPFKFHGQRSTLVFPRQDHSHKPEEMIPLIERVLDGPYLELFARKRPNSRNDWSVWGNEIESDITIPGYPVPSDFTRPTATRSTPADNHAGTHATSTAVPGERG